MKSTALLPRPAVSHKHAGQSDDEEDHNPVDAQVKQTIGSEHAGYRFRPKTHSARVSTSTTTPSMITNTWLVLDAGTRDSSCGLINVPATR